MGWRARTVNDLSARNAENSLLDRARSFLIRDRRTGPRRSVDRDHVLCWRQHHVAERRAYSVPDTGLQAGQQKPVNLCSRGMDISPTFRQRATRELQRSAG